MNRRTFLAALPAAVAGIALTDPARLLAAPSAPLTPELMSGKAVSMLAQAPVINVSGWVDKFLQVGDVITFGTDKRLYVVTAVTSSTFQVRSTEPPPLPWSEQGLPWEDTPVSLMGTDE